MEQDYTVQDDVGKIKAWHGENNRVDSTASSLTNKDPIHHQLIQNHSFIATEDL